MSMGKSVLSLFSVLSAPLFCALSASAAQSPDWKGHCMLVQEGTPPQTPVLLKYGESKELFKIDKFSYQVEYGKILGRKNAIKMTIQNIDTKLETAVLLSFKKFPNDINLVTPESPYLSFTCITRK